MILTYFLICFSNQPSSKLSIENFHFKNINFVLFWNQTIWFCCNVNWCNWYVYFYFFTLYNNIHSFVWFTNLKHKIMSDIEIYFNQDVNANEHARPSPIGEPPCLRAQIQEDFYTPIALDIGCYLKVVLHSYHYRSYIILRLCNKLNLLMFKF